MTKLKLVLSTTRTDQFGYYDDTGQFHVAGQFFNTGKLVKRPGTRSYDYSRHPNDLRIRRAIIGMEIEEDHNETR